MIPMARKEKKMSNYKFALGYGMNWVDLDTGILYHIQEFKEALDDSKIPKDKKPTKIRMTKVSDGSEIGFEDPIIVEKKMKDPPPDPRY